ncbi:hypothetical protein, partial [Sinorhizobium meliloti]|uniref:hypothetical protein n=1 Tax=Rhizobium meliloti TaxID=382 RepID=UPI001AECDD19
RNGSKRNHAAFIVLQHLADAEESRRIYVAIPRSRRFAAFLRPLEIWRGPHGKDSASAALLECVLRAGTTVLMSVEQAKSPHSLGNAKV